MFIHAVIYRIRKVIPVRASIKLLLEEAADGANNFTFSESGEPAALPAIGHMSLYNAAIAYPAAEGPVRRLNMEQVSARKVPGQPVEREAHTAVNHQATDMRMIPLSENSDRSEGTQRPPAATRRTLKLTGPV